MIHKLKMMGTTLVAIFAMSAVAASAAQAGVFKAESYPAAITGQQTSKIEFTGVVGTWTCKTINLQGELAKESSELKLNPIYEGCSWVGIEATVNMTGCYYLFTAGNTIGGSSDKIEVGMDIKCEAGKKIDLTLANECRLKLPEQSLTGITAENTLTAEPKMDVDFSVNIKGLEYIVENGSKCPNSPANGTYTNGTLKGTTTLQGENPATLAPIGWTVG